MGACLQRIATAARAAVTDQFPTLHDQALQNYLQIFKRLDADGDGRVQVRLCFPRIIMHCLDAPSAGISAIC